MCRLLAVRDHRRFAIEDQLRPFAEMARRSREYQGHGWGCAWLEDGQWLDYRSLTPIWEDDFSRFSSSWLLVAHARSAFRNEGITLEHNMPFVLAGTAFVFNGELRGVRIAEQGRIGAEKLFRFLLRHGADGGNGTTRRAIDIVLGRTRYVRAMNFALANVHGEIQLHSCFNEDDDYFTMHINRVRSRLTICSEPLDASGGWLPFPNGQLEVFRC